MCEPNVYLNRMGTEWQESELNLKLMSIMHIGKMLIRILVFFCDVFNTDKRHNLIMTKSFALKKVLS